MSGRLTGVYQLPDGGFPPRDSKLWVRVPVDRNQGGVTVYAAPTMVPINPPTHPTAPGFYDSGDLPEGPYQVQKAIFGAKDYRSKWYSVVLTEGSHTVQELIEDYDPDLYTPPVVSEVAVLRDETRSARDEAAQILEDVEAGAVPDAAVASKITASDTATRAAVDARVAAGTADLLDQQTADATYAPVSVVAEVAEKLDQAAVDQRVAAGTTGLLDQATADATYAPQLGKTFYVDQHGLVGDWTGGDANTGTGTNDTAALISLIADAPDGSTLIFDAAKIYRLNPLTITGKSLILDFNGAGIVTKTMDAGNLAVAQPFISWTSGLGVELNLASAGFARGATEVITNPFSAANGLAAGDLVIIRDEAPIAKWDTGTNVSWVGHGEVNIVRSVAPSTGTVRLQVPLSHTLASNGGISPKIRKITSPARPIIRNIGKISDTNPGGAYTGEVEEAGGHLFYFFGCVDPRVENVYVDGWQNHIVNFNKCLRPRTDHIEGVNPFQVGSGHGYIGRMLHCVDGEFRRHVAYGTRHVANYVGAARCGSRDCVSYRPTGVSYQTHGLDSRDVYSIDDTVVGGDASGWSHGNPQYGADVGLRIERPRFYGTQRGILARSGSKGMRVVDPEIHSTLTGIEISALADDVIVDLTKATIEIFGTDPTAYAVQAADVDGAGTYKPGSVLVLGPGTLTGPRALVSLDVTGAAELGGLRYGAGQAKVWDGSGWRPAATQASTAAANADLGTVLSDAGMRTAGTAYPITTSGAVALTGGFRTGFNTRTANTSIVTTNAPTNMCNASAGAITMTLPSTSTGGHRFLFKKIDSSANTVTIAASSGGSIDGAASVVLDAQYKWVEVISSTTSAVWYIGGRG